MLALSFPPWVCWPGRRESMNQNHMQPGRERAVQAEGGDQQDAELVC